MSAKRQRQRAADHDEQLQHAAIVAGVCAKINSDEFWRGSADVVAGCTWWAVWDEFRNFLVTAV
jgi:hypothetical protein